jgi:type VI secretion system secreted protein VgrG
LIAPDGARRETDLDFITRLLREEGISYYFEFGGEIGLHTLVLVDAGSQLRSAQPDTIRFHRAGATENEDSTQWNAARQIRSGSEFRLQRRVYAVRQ